VCVCVRVRERDTEKERERERERERIRADQWRVKYCNWYVYVHYRCYACTYSVVMVLDRIRASKHRSFRQCLWSMRSFSVWIWMIISVIANGYDYLCLFVFGLCVCVCVRVCVCLSLSLWSFSLRACNTLPLSVWYYPSLSISLSLSLSLSPISCLTFWCMYAQQDVTWFYCSIHSISLSYAPQVRSVSSVFAALCVHTYTYAHIRIHMHTSVVVLEIYKH